MDYIPNNVVTIGINKQRLKAFINDVESIQVLHSGVLEPKSFIRFVEHLYAEGFTGIILFDSAEVQKVVYIKNGYVVFARSSINDERLGETLCRMGKLTEEALIKASKEITPTRRLGKVLVENGYITSRDLWLGVKRQIFEIWGSYILLSLEASRTWFHAIKCTIDETNIVKPNTNMLDSLFEFLREKVDSLNVRIGQKDLVHLNYSTNLVAFNIFEKAIVDYLIKNNDIQLISLAKEINADESSTETVLKPLIHTGILSVVRSPLETEQKTEDNRIKELLEITNTVMGSIAEIMSKKAPEVNFKTNVRDYVKLSGSIFKDCEINEHGNFDINTLLDVYKKSKSSSSYKDVVDFIKELIQFELFEMKNYLPKDQTIELENMINLLE
ncbi:MAG: DUF4388 domain-containing protein [bacterium]